MFVPTLQTGIFLSTLTRFLLFHCPLSKLGPFLIFGDLLFFSLKRGGRERGASDTPFAFFSRRHVLLLRLLTRKLRRPLSSTLLILPFSALTGQGDVGGKELLVVLAKGLFLEWFGSESLFLHRRLPILELLLHLNYLY